MVARHAHGVAWFVGALVGLICAIWVGSAMAIASTELSPMAAIGGGLVASAMLAILSARALSRMLDGVVAQATALTYGFIGDTPAPPPGEFAPREFAEIHESLAVARAALARREAAERQAIEQACIEHDMLASVVAGTVDIIYVKDRDLRFVLANSAARSRGLRPPAEWPLIGGRASAMLPPEAAAHEEALERHVLQTGETQSSIVIWPDADGGVRHMALSRSAWRDIDGVMSGVVVVGRDVTDQRAAERRLATTQANLLRATRLSAMGAMASGLAHELNQPLAAATNFIAATARLLDQAFLPPDAPARVSLGDAGTQLLRTKDIVRRLAGFVERGEAELQLEDASVMTREACEVARAEAFSPDAQLEVAVGSEPCMAFLDRTQMQQVLLNLIRNAVEAFEPGAPGHIRVACVCVQDAVEITVSDDGPGLAPSIAARLFQPFASTKQHGMGIGLTICRTIVEGHGGVLSASSAPGQGTIFTVRLPQAGWWERGGTDAAAGSGMGAGAGSGGPT